MSVAKNTTNLTIRLDSDLKKDCEALYAELGMSLSTAINVFLRQSLRKGGLPFDARLDDQPNRTTIEAMLRSTAVVFSSAGSKKAPRMCARLVDKCYAGSCVT